MFGVTTALQTLVQPPINLSFKTRFQRGFWSTVGWGAYRKAYRNFLVRLFKARTQAGLTEVDSHGVSVEAPQDFIMKEKLSSNLHRMNESSRLIYTANIAA
jgi:hypothetical protein